MVKKDDLLIPIGWVKAFGDDLCKELNKIDRGIEILDSKEKYGELRLLVDPYSENAGDVESKYCEISRHICIKCGKPDTPMMDFGWISPVCKDCWPKFSGLLYEDCICGHAECPPYITIKRYSTEWKDESEKRIDLSEEIKRIRRRYKNETASVDATSGGNADGKSNENVGEATGRDKE